MRGVRFAVVAALLALARPTSALDAEGALGDFKSADRYNGAADEFLVTTVEDNALRIHFYSASIVRVWLADPTNGNWSDPASEDIVVGKPHGVQATMTSAATEVSFTVDGGVTLTVHKAPLTLSMHGANGTPLWAEASPLSWNANGTAQTLASNSVEAIFGGGMQNGAFAHKGQRILITTSNNWADGGDPNAVPFYVSSAGYAVYRNTWAPGAYDFTSESVTVTTHKETRFDAYFMAGNFTEVLAAYTDITGPPFMVPIYGLGLGDSDCYHNERHGNSTQLVLTVADQYRERDFPGAWFLPNDGYGCGFGESPTSFPKDFADLDIVVAELHKRGFYTGLWSSTGLPNITREVAGSGVRIGKTDVGWIGAGYKYAFNSVQLVSNGIEQNSDGRRFIWTVDGWAGTHRYAVMWTGDDTGCWDYIRWQIPTFVGAGFSAMAHVSGDIDGIFGGSPDTYTRDLQYKCLMTTMMAMSGWAGNPDKQPWTWGEPYASINRMYLKLKARLTPYFYTLSRLAYDTGIPPIRAMALEFPLDPLTYTNWTGTAYQFMAGPSLLVAPVFENATIRDGIYLPSGEWYDWWDGAILEGNTTLNGYSAPLDKLPLFVKAGSIVPMWPPMNYFNEKPHDPITFEIFPGSNFSSSFTLYEDDGVTRAGTESAAYTKTTIFANVTTGRGQKTHKSGGNITIGPARGAGYNGQPSARNYSLNIHGVKSPSAIQVNGVEIEAVKSLYSLDAVSAGWYFNKALFGGLLMVKVASCPASTGCTIELLDGSKYPRICLEQCDTVLHHQVVSQVFTYASNPGPIVYNVSGACLTVSSDMDEGSGTPALELQPCKAKAGNQDWSYSKDTQTLTPTNSPKKCADQDVSDSHVEMYSCGNGQANQKWAINADGKNHIRQAELQKLCMTPCADDTSSSLTLLQQRQRRQRYLKEYRTASLGGRHSFVDYP